MKASFPDIVGTGSSPTKPNHPPSITKHSYKSHTIKMRKEHKGTDLPGTWQEVSHYDSGKSKKEMARGARTAPMALCLLAAAASAQSSSSGCTSALVSLSPCLDYISGNETTAPSSCCSQLETVVRSEPQCLCAALGGGSSSLGGASINKTRALGLPGACKVQTPPVSECNGTGGGSKATPTTPYLVAGVRGSVGLVVGLAVVAVYTVSAV